MFCARSRRIARNSLRSPNRSSTSAANRARQIKDHSRIAREMMCAKRSAIITMGKFRRTCCIKCSAAKYIVAIPTTFNPHDDRETSIRSRSSAIIARMRFALAAIAIALAPFIAAAAVLVDINTADLASLETLSGIGPSKAQAVVDYRTQHGPFQKIEDIQNVSGIGAATYDKIKASITVGDAQAPQVQTTQSQQSSSDASTSPATSSASASSPAPTPSYVAPPEPIVFADAGADKTVIVGADTEFYGRAYDKKKQTVDRVRFSWNFGDGSTAEGPSVVHHYDYPGRYAVVLSIAEDRESASDYAVVTAEPARLAFKMLPDGGVAIENLSGHDLDLSRWVVRSYNTAFTLPDHSIVLMGEALRIGQKTLGFFSSAAAELDYPNGVLALRANDVSQTTVPAEPIAAVELARPRPVPRVRAETPEPDAGAPAAESSASSSAQTAAAASGFDAGAYWWALAALLGVVSGGAAWQVRRVQKTEWDVIEDSA